ncbi:MAG: acyl--CoA ligase, partial [Clostridia bacterium]|nr:acyl--CoA ligase [Clostridia bacterium]
MLTNILQYLESTAPRLPDKLAFSTGTEGLTFSELHTHARCVGASLLRRGYTAEPVAVLMDKHPHTIATFFGALYAGCFYAALDGDMPVQRMGLILDTLKPRLLIYDKKNAKNAQKLLDQGLFGGIILPWEELCHAEGRELTADDEAALRAIRDRQIDTDPIYVVFTSGSTGVPKGVIACHRSVI